MANTISINWQGPGFYFKNQETGVFTPVKEFKRTNASHGGAPGRTYLANEKDLDKFLKH